MVWRFAGYLQPSKTTAACSLNNIWYARFTCTFQSLSTSDLFQFAFFSLLLLLALKFVCQIQRANTPMRILKFKISIFEHEISTKNYFKRISKP